MKIIVLALLLLMFSSCQKKKAAESIVQRTDNYIPPSTETVPDSTQPYSSPTDAFKERSMFADTNFRISPFRFHGVRNLHYQILRAGKNYPTIVVEFLSGTWKNGDTVSTATRFLLYSGNMLLYRKAFALELSDAENFSTIKKFNKTVWNVSKTKAVIYYWIDNVRSDSTTEREYHAVSMNTEGITSELTGGFTRIGGNIETVNFLTERRVKASATPNARYPQLAVELNFSLDWKSCSATLDVPADTVFPVSGLPLRLFKNEIILHSSPVQTSPLHEADIRQRTRGQMQLVYLPSFFEMKDITRDRLFVEFNRTLKGWIDYESMKREGIISEH